VFAQLCTAAVNVNVIQCNCCVPSVTVSSCPEYYVLIKEPVDFVTIKRNIDCGRYTSAAGFDADCEQCFTNIEVSRRLTVTSDMINTRNVRC